MSTLGHALDRLERQRRMQEADRRELELQAAEERERAAEAQRQREARDRRDREVRAVAYRAQERRTQVRQEFEASVDEFNDLAARLAAGRAEEQDVIGAYRRREEAKAVSEAWELGFSQLKGDPAIAGRR